MSNIEIPKEIKSWNWGAFALTPFWCLRHGVWYGLFLIVPLFGCVVPFILGVKGNQKAWLKNTQEPLEKFLKRQKYWNFAGLVALIVMLGGFPAYLFYSINYSEGMKMGLQTANSNKRLTEYFGQPIKKTSFFNGSYHYTISPKPSILSVTFNAIGSRNKGCIHFIWEKRDEDWVAMEMAFTDSEGKTYQLVDSPIIMSSFYTDAPYQKSCLVKILDKMIQERDGSLVLNRSEKNNDFMQTAVEVADDNDVVFFIEYSDGYTMENKKLYQGTKTIQDKEEIITLFTKYASGDDSHINLIEWSKLTSIISEGENSICLIFGERE